MDQDYILKFKELVDADFKRHKNVSYYAVKLDISRYTLSQKTLNVEGKSPKKIIDDIVMDKAKRLLLRSDDSIKEIALALGFNDPTNFHTFFRKHEGVTPSGFREKIRT